jgi:hypothetical protein
MYTEKSNRLYRTVCYELSEHDKRPRPHGGPWHPSLDHTLSWAQFLYEQGFHVFIESDARKGTLNRYLPCKPVSDYR